MIVGYGDNPAGNREAFRVDLGLQQQGDFNHDGMVDGNDFLAWQRGESPNPLSQSDLNDWQEYFGAVASPITAGSTTVPEPSTGIMLLLVMAAILLGRWTVVSKLNSA